MRPTKQVIVMRRDLGMRRGKEISQGSHASMSFLTRKSSFMAVNDETVKELFTETVLAIDTAYTSEQVKAIQDWMSSSFTKVCLRVDSEEELLEIHRKALEAGLISNVVVDSGKTEFHGVPTTTCLAIGPDYSDNIDPVTSHLKLL